MARNAVLHDLAGPSEALFHDALIAGLARVAAAIGRGALADQAGRTTRSLDMLFSGDTELPKAKGFCDFLLADPTALDEVFALYGGRYSPLTTQRSGDLATLGEMSAVLTDYLERIADGIRCHRDTLALADRLRSLLPKLAAIVAEADALRGVGAR